VRGFDGREQIGGGRVRVWMFKAGALRGFLSTKFSGLGLCVTGVMLPPATSIRLTWMQPHYLSELYSKYVDILGRTSVRITADHSPPAYYPKATCTIGDVSYIVVYHNYSPT